MCNMPALENQRNSYEAHMTTQNDSHKIHITLKDFHNI